jgi:predicted nucleotidyltransferase
MGPGRWGSRGDIKLGVNVTYSDINNTAVLIEIAKKKGNYVPDLSFGTHFFQDLVEAAIRYLPLYPDDEGNIFNEEFLSKSPNALFEILPAYSHLSEIIRVIEIPAAANGMVLRVLMNADVDQAIAMLSPKGSSTISTEDLNEHYAMSQDNHWRWRMNMTDKIASQMDPKRFGVKAMYVVGSTIDASAQAGSDIDLLINFNGTKEQEKDLLTWLEGWSLSLDEMNFLRTGYKAGGLLDVHLVNDEELADLEKIGAKLKIRVEGMKELALSGKIIEENK